MSDNAKVNVAATALAQHFCRHEPQSAAYNLESIPSENAYEILNAIPVEISIAVWEALSPYVAAQLIEFFTDDKAITILESMDPGKSSSILSLLESERRESLFARIDEATKREFQTLIEYPPDSAGWLMDTRIMRFTPEMKVSEALAILNRITDDVPVYELRLVDSEQRLHSIVDIKDLALSKPSSSLQQISRNIPVVASAVDSREEVVEKMEKFRLEELTVIDEEGHILGVIRHSSLIGALKADATIDIQTMVGASKDERATSSSFLAIRKRMPWLQVNLVTAFLAAAVVGLFEGTIAQFTALAILLPVVAGQSGNAGAQALAVTMRGLALREIRVHDWFKMAVKESTVGLWNGVAIAIVCGIGVYIWSGQIGLVAVIMSSMIIAMVLAGLAGALVPIALTRIGQDPAVASSIVLTTITDIAGFLSFLGIATLLSAMLM